LKTVIVYLPLNPDKAKLANLPVKLPILAEDFEKVVGNNELSIDVILRGLEAQVKTGKKLDYYLSYLVYALYDVARDKINHRNFDEARENVEKAASYKKDYRYPFHLGIIERETGNLEKSEMLLRESLSMNENFLPARLELSRTLMDNGELEDAIGECKKIMEIDPNFTLSYIVMGDSYLKLGDPKSSLMLYQKALSIDPNIPSVHWRIGVAANMLQKFSLAEKEFKVSISNSEGGWQARYNLSYSLYRLGKVFDALELLKGLLEEGIKTPEVVTELVIIQKLLGLYVDAEENVKIAEKMEIKERGLLLAAIDVYAFNGAMGKARAICDENQDPDFVSRKTLLELEDNWNRDSDIQQLAKLLNSKNVKLSSRLKDVKNGIVSEKEVFDESLLSLFNEIVKIHGTHPYSAEKALTQCAVAFSGSIETVALFLFLYRIYLKVNAFGSSMKDALESVVPSIVDISWKIGKKITKIVDGERRYDVEENASKEIGCPTDGAEFFAATFLILDGHPNPIDFLKSTGVSQTKIEVLKTVISLQH